SGSQSGQLKTNTSAAISPPGQTRSPCDNRPDFGINLALISHTAAAPGPYLDQVRAKSVPDSVAAAGVLSPAEAEGGMTMCVCVCVCVCEKEKSAVISADLECGHA